MLTADYYIKHGDPRVLSYPFMESSMPTLIITFVYLIFIKLVGPTLMKDRPAFQLRIPMAIYNFILVIFSTWAFLEIFYLWLTKYNFRCESVDFSNNKDALKMVLVGWCFYASKFVEFMDTIFFILRKKDSQITKLHITHHCLTPISGWLAVKYGSGGAITFFMMNNLFVHIWMYLYYLLSGMGPEVQKYLCWKKYLTSLQMAQFVIGFFFYGSLFLSTPESCKISSFNVRIKISEAVLYYLLFSDFYRNNYQKKSQKEKQMK